MRRFVSTTAELLPIVAAVARRSVVLARGEGSLPLSRQNIQYCGAFQSRGAMAPTQLRFAPFGSVSQVTAESTHTAAGEHDVSPKVGENGGGKRMELFAYRVDAFASDFLASPSIGAHVRSAGVAFFAIALLFPLIAFTLRSAADAYEQRLLARRLHRDASESAITVAAAERAFGSERGGGAFGSAGGGGGIGELRVRGGEAIHQSADGKPLASAESRRRPQWSQRLREAVAADGAAADCGSINEGTNASSRSSNRSHRRLQRLQLHVHRRIHSAATAVLLDYPFVSCAAVAVAVPWLLRRGLVGLRAALLWRHGRRVAVFNAVINETKKSGGGAVPTTTAANIKATGRRGGVVAAASAGGTAFKSNTAAISVSETQISHPPPPTSAAIPQEAAAAAPKAPPSWRALKKRRLAVLEGSNQTQQQEEVPHAQKEALDSKPASVAEAPPLIAAAAVMSERTNLVERAGRDVRPRDVGPSDHLHLRSAGPPPQPSASFPVTYATVRPMLFIPPTVPGQRDPPALRPSPALLWIVRLLSVDGVAPLGFSTQCDALANDAPPLSLSTTDVVHHHVGNSATLLHSADAPSLSNVYAVHHKDRSSASPLQGDDGTCGRSARRLPGRRRGTFPRATYGGGDRSDGGRSQQRNGILDPPPAETFVESGVATSPAVEPHRNPPLPSPLLDIASVVCGGGGLPPLALPSAFFAVLLMTVWLAFVVFGGPSRQLLGTEEEDGAADNPHSAALALVFASITSEHAVDADGMPKRRRGGASSSRFVPDVMYSADDTNGFTGGGSCGGEAFGAPLAPLRLSDLHLGPRPHM